MRNRNNLMDETSALCPLPEDRTTYTFDDSFSEPRRSPRRPFHRRSSVIDAVTGRKVRRIYSFWNETHDEEPEETPKFHHYLSKPVIKAALTYLIASVAVYSSTISALLGESDSNHLICTVVVYFHASRSKGSMLQSLMFVAMSLTFAFVTSILLMLMSQVFDDDGEPESFTTAIVLILCSAALGFVSFMKHRVSKQNFNTACSLCAIVIVSCVIKEGALGSIAVPWKKIGSTFVIVVFGCLISVLSCYTIWPTSGITKLHDSLNECAELLGVSLRDITNSFLAGTSVQSMDIPKAIQKMNGAWEEAQYELLAKGEKDQCALLEKLVASNRRLASSISGLQLSVEFQRMLIGVEDDSVSIDSIESLSFNSSYSIEDAQVPKELFDLFIYNLGPSMKSFVHTIRQILAAVPYTKEGSVNEDADKFKTNLEIAANLFQINEAKALDAVYRQDLFKEETGFENKLDQEQVAASCANFAFSMIEFGNELGNYLEILKQLGVPKPHGLPSLPKFKQGRKVEVFNGEDDDDGGSGLGYTLWKLFRTLKQIDYQFGIRVGIGAMVMGSLAYLPATKETFVTWRLEWALITYCIIMNKSVGGTNMTVKWRFIGTFVGALVAYINWKLFFPHYILMALVGFLVALPCFHIILNWPANNAFGRFILLTYNLTILYSYTMSIGENEDNNEGGANPIILEIAFHRFVAVSLGIVWAVVVTMTLFPVSARSRLRMGLSTLWLNLGVMWKQNMLAYTLKDGNYSLNGVPEREASRANLGEARLMLKQAPMEIRLKGPFPTHTYQKLIDCTSHLLDAVENMSAVVDYDRKLDENDHLVISDLHSEMVELHNRIFLFLYMMSSAVRLEYPLAATPASVSHPLNRILVKLSDLRDRTRSLQSLTNEDFVLFYTYTLVVNSTRKELDTMLSLMTELFGTVDSEIL